MAYNPVSIEYVPQYKGDEGLVLHFAVTAAETFLKGDLLKIASGKVLVQATANAGPHLGIALNDALSVATPGTAATLRNYVSVQVIRVGDLWVGRLGSSETYADTDSIGTSYDCIKVASGNWRPSKATAAPSLKLVASAEVASAIGAAGPAGSYTAGGPVYFKFLSAATTTQWNV